MMNNFKKYAPIVVRIGIALVFLWFGFQQLFNPESLVSYLPLIAGILPIKAVTLIIFNGIIEIVLGLMLILGIYTRIVSALLGLHMIGIIFSVGYNEIGVRDFGLLMALIAVFLNGDDEWCLGKVSSSN